MGTPSIDTTSHDAVITTDNTPTEIASGNDLLVQVTGQVGKTIVWEILEDSVR